MPLLSSRYTLFTYYGNSGAKKMKRKQKKKERSLSPGKTAILLLSCLIFGGGFFVAKASAEEVVDVPLNRLTQGAQTSPPMVSFPGGTFQMGNERGDEDEAPVHQVTLSAFKIDAAPVTNLDYNTYLVRRNAQAPAHLAGENFEFPNQPVVKVSWYEADAYCKAQGKRLPTEAEYEYLLKSLKVAITGVSDDKPLPVKSFRSLFNFYGAGDDFDYTSAVGSFPGSNLKGVSDLLGNVWEWTGDWYAPYEKEDVHNPSGAVKGEYKVLRGASWVNPVKDGFESFRARAKPFMKTEFYGFRCAATAIVP